MTTLRKRDPRRGPPITPTVDSKYEVTAQTKKMKQPIEFIGKYLGRVGISKVMLFNVAGHDGHMRLHPVDIIKIREYLTTDAEDGSARKSAR